MKSKNSQSFKIILLSLLFTVIILLTIFLFISYSTPEVIFDSSIGIGIKGPLVLQFDREMDQKSIEERLFVSPQIPVTYTWEGETLFIFPEIFFLENQSYQIKLEKGGESLDGKKIHKTHEWECLIRKENIVFLHPAGSDGNIWRLDLEDEKTIQLTENLREIYDFSISNNGNYISYSEKNNQDGIDLWKVDRNGDNSIKMIDCGKDWCIESAWSQTDKVIAYTRIQMNNGQAEGIMKSIWLLNINTQQSVPLLNDSHLQGETPLWSPSGKYLAFLDSKNELIHILNLKTNQIIDFSAISGIIGSWMNDGDILLYTENIEDILVFNSVIYEADPESGLRKKSDIVEFVGQKIFNKALISPDGGWVLLSAKDLSATGASQLWIVHKDGNFGQMITDDFLSTHSTYSWDFVGNQLVYQRLLITSSSNKPEILVWDRECHICDIVFKDATFPQWMP